MKPLQEAVGSYLEKGRAWFHMPGHKGRGDGAFAEILPWDVTEVDGCDSLFHADGPIDLLEQAFSRVYGTRRTLLCAGGATLCIQTMLALACGTGRKLVISRNIHRSAINACALLGLEPVWVYPEQDAGDWFLGRYSPEAVGQALAAHPDAAAVYLTSPDYFGVMSDLTGIAEACRDYGVPLLADNAHGAHLPFLPERYGCLHPISCGAALCGDSLHKTMPAMTGAALLQIGEERFAGDAKRMMSMFGSTSPSYPIMLSCERALGYAQKGAKEGFARTTARLDALRILAQQHGFALPQGVTDPARLTLGFGALGWPEQAFGDYIRAHGIEPEYISGSACVFLANGMNSDEDFARLEAAVRGIKPRGNPDPVRPVLPHPVRAMGVREAAFAPQEQVPVGQALGRVAAAEASPCPPGIPVVMGGEQIGPAELESLRLYGVKTVNVVR